MTTSLESLVASGTRLWLDSVDPDLVVANRALGATGATSNPAIVSGLIKSGRFDEQLESLAREGLADSEIAWQLTDSLVSAAEKVFLPVWEETRGDDGYVSFELDPLLEDSELGPPHDERVAQYIAQGKKWAAGHPNRMIKVPATEAGLASVEELCAAGVTLNVTLIFTARQYRIAREAAWRGAQRRDSLDAFKSVYSIFVSRVDVYTEKHVPQLSAATQGLVGIVGAKRIWAENQEYWSDRATPLAQEMIFASTGTKKPEDPSDKYVRALAGSDIQTNPPETNAKVQESGLTFAREVDILPPAEVLAEIDAEVDLEQMEKVLMEEGVKKFSDPQKALLALIGEKRTALSL